MAIQSVACPLTASARKIALSPIDNETFVLMLKSARRLSLHRERDLREIVPHQRDVCCFERRIASSGTHHDTQVRGGECGRVVHTVANHGRHAVALSQVAHGIDLCGW